LAFSLACITIFVKLDLILFAKTLTEIVNLFYRYWHYGKTTIIVGIFGVWIERTGGIIIEQMSLVLLP
jgi:hypothetical protein